MAEGPHLGHRLPWRSLAQVAKRLAMGHFKNFWWPNDHLELYAAKNKLKEEEKAVDHFSQCLADAIKEFAETDPTSYEDKEKYDPSHPDTDWDVEYSYSIGAYVGYYDSLIQGYIELNILLLDPDTWKHVVLRENGKWSRAMQLMCGFTDGRHPKWLADHLRPIFDEHGYLKPVTADVVEIMREHAKLIFRCLYSIGPTNSMLNWKNVKCSHGLEYFAYQTYWSG
ncbi:hypothetical protein Poli38472_000717 [Pythium oligandrum]|uniref:Uncharacterized protein n=1 Tax=Pythium oligandrum TaxID=41045 RepID=A0A8K1FEL5_PYTOL|nr:hypothetical protein Poli38472_000717 [Pythium oligandrum]|eukprot:TMW60675.1 hypothetical protein Poli38472_000717 [Pythium oligandrum]